jgi:hypothetical protein
MKTRNGALRGILGVITLVATSAIGAELINPSFDEPKVPEPPECDQANGWERWGSWANRHTNETDQTIEPRWQSRSGPGLMAYHHWQSDSVDAGWFQDVTDLLDGSYYRFSVWAKSAANCNASKVQMRIEPLTGTEPYAIRDYSLKDIGENWTYITVWTKLPPEVREIRCKITCVHGFSGNIQTAVGSISFDDAKLERLTVHE